MNLDKIFEKAKTQTEFIIDKASEKGAEVWDVSKAKLKIFDLKSEISTDYKDLGKLVFDSQTGTNVLEEDLQKLIAEILRKKTKIDFLNKEINERKKPKVCKNCNTICDNEAKGCSNCGEKI